MSHMLLRTELDMGLSASSTEMEVGTQCVKQVCVHQGPKH
jgi:hypothetical protein